MMQPIVLALHSSSSPALHAELKQELAPPLPELALRNSSVPAAVVRSKGKRTRGHVNQSQVHFKCIHPEGCSRSASFGYSTSYKRLFCSLHRSNHHQDKKHVVCQDAACRRQGTYWDGRNESSSRYCRAHKRPGDVRISSSKCAFPDCSEKATHGFSNFTSRFTSPMWCKNHSDESQHVDLRRRVCQAEECERTATHGDPVQRRMIHCSMHKTAKDVDLRHKRCQYLEGNCYRQPSYGDPEEKIARFCSRHRSPWHVDVRNLLFRRSVQNKAVNILGGIVDDFGDQVYPETVQLSSHH